MNKYLVVVISMILGLLFDALIVKICYGLVVPEATLSLAAALGAVVGARTLLGRK